MKKYQVVLIILVLILTSSSISLAIEQLPVAADAVSYLQVAIKPNDPGITWLYKNWATTPRKSSIREICAKLRPVSGTIVIYPNVDKISYAAIFTYPQSIENTVKLEAFIKNALKNDLGTNSNWSKYPESGRQIIFGMDSARKNGLGFCLFDNQVIIGNTMNAIQKTIQVEVQRQPNIATIPDFMPINAKLISNPDIIIFCNNSEKRFTRFLAVRETKWKMSLLLSSQNILSIVIGIDVNDPDRLKGAIVFKSAGPKWIDDITDDAEFIGEAFRRKFIVQKIQWNSKVTTSGNYVTLQFDIAGLKPLWQELFKVGGLSVVR